MMLIEEATVPEAALPVAAFKAHLRLGSGFSEDSLQDEVLESFLRAAMSAVEARTGKALIRRVFGWTVYDWRDPEVQALPVAPVSALTELTLTDAQGGTVTVASSAYQLVQDSHRPVVRAVAGSLPGIPAQGSATLRFEAGFGPVWEDIPPDLRQAVLLLAAHYYEFRQDTTLSEGCMPFGVTSLLERYRAVRLSLGAVV